MHSHTHVDIHSGGVPHFPEEKEKSITIWKYPPLPLTPGQVSGHCVTQNFSDCWKQSQDSLLWQKIAALGQEKGRFFLVASRRDQPDETKSSTALATTARSGPAIGADATFQL